MSPELTRNAQISILEGRPNPVSAQLINSITSQNYLFNAIPVSPFANSLKSIKINLSRTIETELQDRSGQLFHQKGQFLEYNETFALINVLQISIKSKTLKSNKPYSQA